MDLEAILLAASIPSGIAGMCFFLLERKIDKRLKEQEKRENAKRQNEIIIIEGMNAAIALGEATARAVQRIPDAKCNGDMHAALDYATSIKHKHKDFMAEQCIEALY